MSHLFPTMMNDFQGARIHITGIVQGVGFRPFVYGLAQRLALTGWVRNTSAGVDIQVDGPPEILQQFIQALKSEAPPLARIDRLDVEACQTNGFKIFEIIHSAAILDAFQPISPDVSICPDCLAELFDPLDRRYRYPFINCTNCGPRFTIIQDIPYDRPKTTMSGFDLCSDCAREYQDPLDRRFHAQPVACPACGPHIWLELTTSLAPEIGNTKEAEHPRPLVARKDAALEAAQQLLLEGKIVAIKGLGGFHLACDATNPDAVAELRRRKLRIDKPFALMMPDLPAIEQHCLVSNEERNLLEARQRPIVILQRKPGSSISSLVTPGQDTLGVMLPYSPLHYLLFSPLAEPHSRNSSTSIEAPRVLVMTSGNLSEEPIAMDNQEARQRLASLADAFLMHNRPINTRCDDSVVRVFVREIRDMKGNPHASQLLPIRRSRGYAPFPVRLPWNSPPLLAVGAELKNTFCLTHGDYAFLSHHIGDLENYETLRSFEDGITHLERLFRTSPVAIGYDMHPDYLATRYAMERSAHEGLPAFGVQHHHAHVAACMAEHGLLSDDTVIGIAFDGTGYGVDGAIWGGEFLLANYQSFQRLAHLSYIPLSGGEKAIREPWRIALTWLNHTDIPWEDDIPPVAYLLDHKWPVELGLDTQQAIVDAFKHQITTRLNAPLTSSMGRLFDAVAALCGLRQVVNYEAQAAIEFEAAIDPAIHSAYSFDFREVHVSQISRPAGSAIVPEQTKAPVSHEASDQYPLWEIDPSPIIRDIVNDFRTSKPVSAIATRFHNAIAHMVHHVCSNSRREYKVNQVVLSGGVWQNVALLVRTCKILEDDGFTVYTHSEVPPNDGGLALGQAAILSQLIGMDEKH